MRSMRFRWLALVAAFAVGACEHAPTAPPASTVQGTAGEYRTTAFTTHSRQGRFDVVAAGGSLDLTLRVDGTMSGRLVLPAGATPDGAAVDRVLEGRWEFLDRHDLRLEVVGGVPFALERFAVPVQRYAGGAILPELRHSSIVGGGTAEYVAFEISLARQ
jgi:hypothetical protein